jgi:hypothetical protein
MESAVKRGGGVDQCYILVDLNADQDQEHRFSKS